MEPIIDYLKRRLKEAGPARWEAIAAESGIAKSLPRKIVYDAERDNPRVLTVQPLLDYFGQVDRNERDLPEPALPVESARAA